MRRPLPSQKQRAETLDYEPGFVLRFGKTYLYPNYPKTSWKPIHLHLWQKAANQVRRTA